MKSIMKNSIWLFLVAALIGMPASAFAVTFLIGSEDIQVGAVQTDHIAPYAITNDKIAAGTITQDKLAFTPGGSHYANVVIVAKSGGDFTDPIAAVNSITDASAAKPYLVKIMPGVYDLGTASLQMKEYVDVEGSGAENTVIMSSNNNGAGWICTVGTVVMASNSSISVIKVVNTPPATGDFLTSAAIVFNDVKAEAEGVKVLVGNDAFRAGDVNGICSFGPNAKANLKNVFIETHNNGDHSNPLLVLYDASVTLLNSKLSAFRTGGGTIDAINTGSAESYEGIISVVNSMIEANASEGGAVGIYSEGYNVSVVNSTITLNVGASGWARPYRAYNTGSFKIYSSRIFSDVVVTYQDGSIDVPTKVANSLLPGDRTGLSNAKLVHNYDENFDPIPNQ
jgi:hypothetical protein